MPKDEDFSTIPTTNVDDVIDSLAGSNVGTISDLENIVNQIISSIPKLNKNKIRKEMENMIVQTYQAPTTFDINAGLSVSQSYKDRLTEIYTTAMNEYKTRKRCVEMLFDANNLLSKASSADKRKGEATMKYPIYLLQLETAENFMKEIEQVMNNMKSITETISRQGSMISAQIQLGEYRKKLPSDFNNSSDAEEANDYHSGAPKINVEWDNIR